MNGEHRVVLALSPSPRGFAFVVFYKPDCPIDWGVKEVRGVTKNDRIVAAVARLLNEYRPTILAIEDVNHGRRGNRIRALLASLEQLVKKYGARVEHITRADISDAFLTRPRTKPDTAKAVAERLPAFASHLPGERRIWMSESRWQSLFDAAALGLALYR
jgi:hypothetical protein